MITNLYTIFDKVSKVYNKPFSLLNDQVAIRAAQDLMAGGDTDIALHPADFIMFKLGTYDDTTAQYKADKQLTTIVRFHELPPVMPTTGTIPPVEQPNYKAPKNVEPLQQTGE